MKQQAALAFFWRSPQQFAGGRCQSHEAGAGGDGTSDNRVLPFLDASIGLGAILAVKKRLPPLRVFVSHAG